MENEALALFLIHLEMHLQHRNPRIATHSNNKKIGKGEKQILTGQRVQEAASGNCQLASVINTGHFPKKSLIGKSLVWVAEELRRLIKKIEGRDLKMVNVQNYMS